MRPVHLWPPASRGRRLHHPTAADPTGNTHTITENGCSVEESTTPDQPRIDFMAAHLDALAQAIAEGVDVRGYYTWSLIDNFEWAEGYHQRFGLVHVDFATQKRTPRASYAWYRDLIDSHKVKLKR